MLTVRNTEVMNFKNAMRGARNPMNSWDRSDSYFDENGKYILGENDLSLAVRLRKAGSDHRKFLRQIFVSMDITAPMYWWKEFDTYKVGTVANSTSTMHKIADKEFTLDDFSHEHLSSDARAMLMQVIERLNISRKFFMALDGEEAKQYWWDMIQLLPSSYNQKRTICMSYEVVFKIIRERTGHKLDEWNDFVSILKELPYVKEIMEGMPS